MKVFGIFLFQVIRGKICTASEPPLSCTIWILHFEVTVVEVNPLTPAAKNGTESSIFLPRALICWTAFGGSMPVTTETLTPAFSNTCPSCRTQVIPPPPSFLVQRSTLKELPFSSFSRTLQKSA
ncbi:hypothetical protein ALC60_06999 [Trachymyrmex zeteki]|uniref:Uncharacterized protein n=1 Tax=Mycetomoellerius zeteki TaxID=64791 RepID=A0A151X153_9HYME|nr:hypothetical protein ALC60_06999 [Trachymyrmex zeteki]